MRFQRVARSVLVGIGVAEEGGFGGLRESCERSTGRRWVVSRDCTSGVVAARTAAEHDRR